MVLFGLVSGLGSGAMDAGLNTYFAANHGPRLMNWLHASFGVGATLGPQLVAWLLAVGASWRWAYVVVFAVQGCMGAAFALTLRRWRLGQSTSQEATPRPADVRLLDTLRVPAVWAGVALFVGFTGLEGSAGQWGYVLFTEARKVPATTAGAWISAYWASLTVGRILFGIIAGRIGVTSLVRAGMLGMVCGAALVWWNPTTLLGFLGLALMGFSVAPLFPLSISDTPRQVGSRHAPNAIGFEVAGASVGLTLLPALAGTVAQHLGLETIGPFLFVASLLVFALHEVSVSRTLRRRNAEATA
jgi:fucose permease